MPSLIEIADARREIVTRATRMDPESMSLVDALGRVSAEDVVSPFDQPSYTKSLVDGYALRSSDLNEEGRWSVDPSIVGEIFAGDSPGQTLAAGTVTKIMTGAPLPQDADTIVMRELVEEVDGRLRLAVSESIRPGQHVLEQGAAVRADDVLVRAGRRLRPIEMGVLADANQAVIDVVRRPRVGLIQTGDELVTLGAKLSAGKIVNSNGVMLSALVNQSGATSDNFGIAPDTRDGLATVVQRGLVRSEVLLLSGGVSQGDRDFVPEVLTSLGVDRVFHRVNIRPGKPLWFGEFRASKHGGDEHKCLVFGLPGNPVSSFVSFVMFVLPALRTMIGLDRDPLTTGAMTLANEFELRGARPAFWPGRKESDGSITALPWLGSADPFTLVEADGLIHFSQGDRCYAKGDRVDVVSID